MRVLVCLGLALAALPAAADTVLLKNGGKVDGAVDHVAFLKNGSEKTYARDTFIEVRLAQTADDVLQLDEKNALYGELISVTIRSLGGLLTFKRSEITAVRIRDTSQTALRAEYLARRAKVRDGDASALYDFAAWCKEKGLGPEARDLARRCLAAGPSPQIELLARRLLGYTYKNGKWVPPAPPQAPPPPDSASKPPSDPKRDKIDPALIQIANRIIAEFRKKAADLKNQDQERIRKVFQKDWDRTSRQVKKLKDDIDKATQKRRRILDDIRKEKRRGEGGYPDNPDTYSEMKRKERIDDLRRDYDRLKDRLSRLAARLEKAERDLRQLAVRIKAAKAKARDRARSRERALALARAKLERLLLLGRKLTETQIRNLFAQALRE